MHDRVKTTLGYVFIAVGILVEALTHVSLVLDHVPPRVAAMIDQKAVFFLVLLGFVVLWLRKKQTIYPEEVASTPPSIDASGSFNPAQSVTGQSLENVGNPVQNANPIATATIEQHFYLQQPTHPTTNSVKLSDLEITWKPDEGEPYVHTYPSGTTDNIQYRIRVVNNGAKHLTEVKVWLDKLNPRTSDCVPCIMKLMHDNQDPAGPIPIGPFVTQFSLPPRGERFIDLLLQWPNGSVFWVLHTAIKIDRRIPAQAYTLTIKAEAADTNPEIKSFRLVKSGQIWDMIEIGATQHSA